MKQITCDFLRWTCCIFCCSIASIVFAQKDSSGKEERQSLLYIRYHVVNNQIPYIEVEAKNKLGKVFQPAVNIPVSIYLDSDSSTDALLGKVNTDQQGKANMGLPPAMASKWNSTTSHTLIATTEASKAFDAKTEEATVNIVRLELDTANSGEERSIVVKLMKKDGDSWTPMREVDVKIAVKRYGGNLNVGDETYPTDSTGTAEAAFQLQKLPGDNKGNLELVASVEDNDEVGNLQTSITVPWGIVETPMSSNIDHRTLWSKGTRAPKWLMVMAYGCIIAVWSVILYLVTRIVRIKKLGKMAISE